MTHGSLFSGIGGFDLAAQRVGWVNTFQVEKDNWCRRVLAKNFPDAHRHNDIRDFDGSQYRGTVDVVSGGFPCQPYSTAGQRKGSEDERHLWPEMLRVIREVAPSWVVGENVRGLVSWSDGLVFEQVCADLEAEGYEVQPFLLPAAGVNAPHERYRVWFVAHAKVLNDSGRPGAISCENGGSEFEDLSQPCGSGAIYACIPEKAKCKCASDSRTGRNGFTDVRSISPNAHLAGCEKLNAPSIAARQGFSTGRTIDRWDEWTTEPPVCGMDDGIPRRVDRIRGLGNAIVPDVAQRIFETINGYLSANLTP